LADRPVQPPGQRALAPLKDQAQDDIADHQRNQHTDRTEEDDAGCWQWRNHDRQRQERHAAPFWPACTHLDIPVPCPVDRQLAEIGAGYVEPLYLSLWSTIERLAARRGPVGDGGLWETFLRYQRQVERCWQGQGELDGNGQLVRSYQLCESLHPGRLVA